MALIPPDAGIRMRMQTEANLVQQLAAAHELPADLLDLQPGRTFTARIQEALPENTFKALVAGKSITLSLPEGARAGDQLELVVVDRTAKAIIARQVEGRESQGTSSQPYAYTRLSPAAQLIGQLLSPDEAAQTPTQLNRGHPLLPTAPAEPAQVADLAKALAHSVARSGLFYESHQAQWLEGKRSLPELLQEPQGQRSVIATPLPPLPTAASPLPAALAAAQAEGTPPSAGLPTSGDSADAASGAPDAAVASHAGSPTSAAERNAAASPHQPVESEKVGAGGTAPAARQESAATTTAPQVPEELRPIVQQQLEALATQRMIWHGEVWPQQSIDWEIEWQERQATGPDQEEQSAWRTAVSLTTPRLGQIDANLLLTSQGVRINLTAPESGGAGELLAAAPLLAEALAAAGIPLLSFQVKQADEHLAGQG